MRRILVSLLVFLTIFNAGSVRQREARAVAPALAIAPEVAVVLMIGLAGACAIAARSGVVDAEAARSYERRLRENAESLQNKIKQGLRITAEMMTPVVLLVTQTNTLLGGRFICDQILARVASGGSSAKTNEARRASEGECQPDLRGDPYKCCPNFMKKFGPGKMTSVGRNAFRVSYFGRHARNINCCLEWDSLHGRFEVYDRSNHNTGPRHLGEKACARDQDLDEEDVCSATFIEKADLLSSRHQPRNGCQ